MPPLAIPTEVREFLLVGFFLDFWLFIVSICASRACWEAEARGWGILVPPIVGVLGLVGLTGLVGVLGLVGLTGLVGVERTPPAVDIGPV